MTFYDMKSEPYYELPQDAFRSSDAFDPFLPAEGADARPAPFSDTASPEESGIPLVLGSLLKEELAACLDRGEQAILFVNRRGLLRYAAVAVMCLPAPIAVCRSRITRTSAPALDV